MQPRCAELVEYGQDGNLGFRELYEEYARWRSGISESLRMMGIDMNSLCQNMVYVNRFVDALAEGPRSLGERLFQAEYHLEKVVSDVQELYERHFGHKWPRKSGRSWMQQRPPPPRRRDQARVCCRSSYGKSCGPIPNHLLRTCAHNAREQCALDKNAFKTRLSIGP